jgi:hypothetical protein
MGFSALERETVITFNDAEPVASVYTAQRAVITKLKKNEGARLIKEVDFEGSPSAWFEIPKEFISFRSRPREFSAEERRRRTAQLQRARNAAVALESADSDGGI